jgi:hypothetical protein
LSRQRTINQHSQRGGLVRTQRSQSLPVNGYAVSPLDELLRSPIYQKDGAIGVQQNDTQRPAVQGIVGGLLKRVEFDETRVQVNGSLEVRHQSA